MKSRPKIAFFDLAGCEGCQLQLTYLGAELLDILRLVNLVEFRELLSEKTDEQLDIAFVEGSVVTQESAERLQSIRQRCTKLVAYGSCATIGGINGMKNCRPPEESHQIVYGGNTNLFPVTATRALHQLVKVDYFIHGCPIYLPEFLKVFKCALADLPYRVPDYAVCVECKINENVCFYDKGVTCLGPVTRGGCNAWCINQGNICYGCRGLVSNPNRSGFEELLHDHQLDTNQIAHKITLYNATLESSDG